jgi:hypothetical protein
MGNKRSQATDIPMSVKKKVMERDKRCCIICGRAVDVMPNSHYIPRARGGLGIEENIGTMCTMSDIYGGMGCHDKYHLGSKEEQDYIKARFKEYLKRHYKNWNEEDLVYNKWK